MFNVDSKVGRLIEVTLASPVTLDEIDHATRRMREVLAQRRRGGVISADYAAAKILGIQEAEALSVAFRSMNERFERSAILVSSTSALSVLQMERVIREANNPSRRAFRDPQELVAWLGEILDPPEVGRLRALYADRVSVVPHMPR